MPQSGNNDVPSRPRHSSRAASVTSVQSQHHAPNVSSGLRQSHTPSSIPSAGPSLGEDISREDHVGPRDEEEPHFTDRGIRPSMPHLSSSRAEGRGRDARGDFRLPFAPDTRTRLLDSDNWDAATGCGESDCQHGMYSPRYHSPHKSYGSIGSEASRDGFGGRMPDVQEDALHATMGDTVADGLLGGRGSKMSTTEYLAKRHGVRNSRLMCVTLTSNHLCTTANGDSLGISHTTYHLLTGFDNTNGRTSEATLSQLSRLPPCIYPCRFLTLRILAIYHQSMACIHSSSIRSSMPYSAAVPKW